MRKPLDRRNTLAKDCIHEITRMVTEGELEPGDFLPPQKVLAEQFGVGVSTIREAIQALTAMGLVESRPGKGTWVRQRPSDALNASVVMSRLGEITSRSLHEARYVIEVALTELAAERATVEDIQRMRRALDEMQAAIDDERAYAEADLAFHRAVAAAARNEFLMQFYDLIFNLLSEAITETTKNIQVRLDGIRLQADIVRYIERRDVPKASKAAQRVLTYVAPMFDDRLESPV